MPLDTIEALAWGSNLDWGFNKHPPMSAFVANTFFYFFGAQDWSYYLLSQICVIISFIVVFRFAEDFFEKKIFCLLSVLLLEGIYFYNFTTPEFNVNVCLMPFWSLTVFYIWKGYKDNKIIDWFLAGLFSGFGFLSKYLFIYLGVGVDIFLIYMIYKKKLDLKCLLSLIPFLIVIFPHLIWLNENNYITITYGLDRTGTGDQNFLDHLAHPLIFLVKQFGILIPFFLMFLFLNDKIKSKFNFKDNKLLFLLAINIVPIALVFLTSMIMGVKIRTMWMTPFYLFFGILVIYIFQSQISNKKFNYFFSTFLFLFILSPFTYAYISNTQHDKRTDYEGAYYADLVEDYLKDNKLGRVLLVEGNEWEGGNLCYHLNSRPKCNIFPGSNKTLLFIRINDNYIALDFSFIIQEQLEKRVKKNSND